MQFKNATDFSYVSTATPLPIVLNGVTTNSNAAAGQVGEIIVGSLDLASATSLTTATAANITSISLTAGDWDVCGYVHFLPANTTAVTQLVGSIGTTTATIASIDSGARSNLNIPYTSSGLVVSVSIAPTRLSLSATTTVYLVAQSTFTVSTSTAFGQIRARRVR